MAITIRLHTRRFFCGVEACPRHVFTERLPVTVAPYARRTLRANETLQLIGFLGGGESGARLTAELGMSTSGDTLRRRAAARAKPARPRRG